MSAHTHRRSLRYRTAGFTYHADLDHWECPQGERLWPHEYDHQRRLVRYRAKAHACNVCPLKERCTDSDRGREIVRPLDPWPHSEAGRFHRVIALLMVTLGALSRSPPACAITSPRRRRSWPRCSWQRSPPAAGSRATSARTRPASPHRHRRTACT